MRVPQAQERLPELIVSVKDARHGDVQIIRRVFARGKLVFESLEAAGGRVLNDDAVVVFLRDLVLFGIALPLHAHRFADIALRIAQHVENLRIDHRRAELREIDVDPVL